MMSTLRSLFGLGPKVDLAEVKGRGAQIVDVRTRHEFQHGHIQGSVNIPLDTLEQSAAKLKKDKPVITCCASGMRSASARQILLSAGFKEVHNGGGWQSLAVKIHVK